MKHQIAIFRFTLGHGQSIGPTQLQALWASACQTPHVSVGRTHGARGSDKPTYSLYASQQLEDLPYVEQRLRQLLDQCKLRASLISLHTR
ncbi:MULTISPECIES: hypothetical protein [Lysobacteraceae]|jgi:hypothetical protein|uniref:Uncharacterized protein n=1 Tax=Agrilutibacter niabensis TaxID=380628 RepID=A0ABU1VLS2_9GAMM|nr:hypothetical protein [Lysobacter niabensis]MDR7098417.1 hypothetical protein [Lysobacter niabensis]